jgi:hypothetical protein
VTRTKGSGVHREERPLGAFLGMRARGPILHYLSLALQVGQPGYRTEPTASHGPSHTVNQPAERALYGRLPTIVG